MGARKMSLNVKQEAVLQGMMYVQCTCISRFPVNNNYYDLPAVQSGNGGLEPSLHLTFASVHTSLADRHSPLGQCEPSTHLL